MDALAQAVNSNTSVNATAPSQRVRSPKAKRRELIRAMCVLVIAFVFCSSPLHMAVVMQFVSRLSSWCFSMPCFSSNVCVVSILIGQVR